MKIGDKVRFLNDVGGGKVTGFRPGGIVLVEDADGFEMPVAQNEVVVIGEEKQIVERDKKAPKVSTKAIKEEKQAYEKESPSLNGQEYLLSKTVKSAHREEDTEVDEQTEAKLVRLEHTVQQQALAMKKLEQDLQKTIQQYQQMESRMALLEAKFNLQQNEKMMARQAKPKPSPKPSAPNLEDLQIL